MEKICITGSYLLAHKTYYDTYYVQHTHICSFFDHWILFYGNQICYLFIYFYLLALLCLQVTPILFTLHDSVLLTRKEHISPPPYNSLNSSPCLC